MSRRANVVGTTVAVVTLAALAVFGAEGDARWPWLAFDLAAAAAFLLLLIPEARA